MAIINRLVDALVTYYFASAYLLVIPLTYWAHYLFLRHLAILLLFSVLQVASFKEGAAMNGCECADFFCCFVA